MCIYKAIIGSGCGDEGVRGLSLRIKVFGLGCMGINYGFIRLAVLRV